ncbi:MAG: hypothetical protein KIS92_15320 [Planctomycetota bacterium]|nr:hypothetical protein [Planctomycetota bacterium]
MLVAVFISMIIFAIGFTLLNGATQARSDAQARIRATDAARIVFDMLERDIADAYPGPWATPYVKGDLIKTPGSVIGTSLEMSITDESTTSTVGVNTVRYYVLASTKILYREVRQDVPGGTPSLAATPAHDGQFALLPDIERMDAAYLRFDETSKAFVDASALPETATHINVLLQIKDPNDKQPMRTYQKSFAIPAAFEN